MGQAYTYCCTNADTETDKNLTLAPKFQGDNQTKVSQHHPLTIPQETKEKLQEQSSDEDFFEREEKKVEKKKRYTKIGDKYTKGRMINKGAFGHVY